MKTLLIVLLTTLSTSILFAQQKNPALAKFIHPFEKIIQTGNFDLIDDNFVSLEHLEAFDGSDRDLSDSLARHLELTKETFKEFRDDLIARNADVSSFHINDRLIRSDSQDAERQFVFYFSFDGLTYQCMGILLDSITDEVVFSNGFMWSLIPEKSRE
ncbi:MAG: hypothetical protein QNK23_03905 [Crocinitomicaceae bacterium]|nr:hypothetical protein [Crocinitomicaceae bacterium]